MVYYNRYVIEKKYLIQHYIERKLSAKQISQILKCSESGINYWLNKYKIQKRSISDAVYDRWNKGEDPFNFKEPHSKSDQVLLGVGIGLFWGEGTKRNLHSVRLGNSDPELSRIFLEFLKKVYRINFEKIRIGIQIFNDINEKKVLDFWSKKLSIPKEKFYKVIYTKSRGIGTYKNKIEYGVATIYFGNKKLRDHLMNQIEKVKKMY